MEFDELSRKIEAQRRATAEKLESERRAAQELEIAKQVQARLFPQTLPPLTTLEYAGICIQARQVGGDYYDFLDLGPRTPRAGDRRYCRKGNRRCSPDGQSAGESAQPVRYRSRSTRNISCAPSISSFSKIPPTAPTPRSSLPNMTTVRVACATPIADISARFFSAAMTRWSASIPPPPYWDCFKDWDCSIGERRLFPGDTLALYTDGITEAFNPAEEEFGEHRLIAALRRHRDLPSQSLLASVVDEVRQFSPHEQHDDITLIVARCRGH